MVRYELPTITLHVEQDDIPVRGNAAASGNDTFDREVEDEILERLENGDVWAWASVEVRAELQGLSASAYLGCCNYEDEEAFKKDGYYEDMVREAVDSLAIELENLQNIRISVEDTLHHLKGENK